MPDNRQNLPGKGLFGWLGRQVGHIAKAAKTDVSQPSPLPTVAYRTDQVEQIPHPSRPGLILRRTITDEVVVQPPAKPPVK